MGLFDGQGFHPVDAIASRLDNMRAHPFQTGARAIGGMLGGPLVGAALGRGFGMYNNRQNQNAYNSTQARTVQQGNQAGQRGMEKPLNGPLGNVPGGSGPNADLASALMGNSGGPGMNATTWNMSQLFGGGPTSSSQMINGIMSGIPNGSRPDYLNSPQAGGNLGIPSSGANVSGPMSMPAAGYSQAGGGYGAGTWNGGGGMHSFQVNSGSLSPSNYGGLGGGGIARGRGRENGFARN